jgi:predicted glycosyltransferase
MTPPTDSRKRVAFFPNHPSQIWMLRPVAERVSEFATPIWLLRDKDCSLELAEAFGLDYQVVSKAKTGFLGNGIELAANTVRCWRLTRKLNIDLWVTKYGCGNIAAKIARKRSLSFNDDDADVIPLIAWTSYPFADATIVTDATRMGRFEKNAIRYPGFHELFYLHPNRFTPDPGIKNELKLAKDERFLIVRLSALNAHHDAGISGVSEQLLRDIIRASRNQVRVFISSEKPISSEFEPYRFTLAVDRMHHALAFAELFVGDSQTMTAEAAVLGTPSFRLNSFVGKIGYLDELERYGLSKGFRPGQEADLLNAIQNAIENPLCDRKSRREQMLADKPDPVPAFVEAIKAQL